LKLGRFRKGGVQRGLPGNGPHGSIEKRNKWGSIEIGRMHMSTKFMPGSMRYDNTEKLNIATELKKFSANSGMPDIVGGHGAAHALGSEDLQALYEVSRAVNSTLILDEILNIVMKKSIELLKAERGFLMLLDSDGNLQFKTAHNIKKQELDKSDLQVSTTIAEGVVKSGLSVYTSDALSDGRFAEKRSVLQMNIRSAMCVPLKIKDQMIGVVYLDNSSKANIFLQSDLYLFELFADQAALAIQNAQLYTELFALQRFQEAILDKTPVAIIVMEENGKVRSLNRAAIALFEKAFLFDSQAAGSIVGKNFLEMLPENEREFWRDNMSQSRDRTVDVESHQLKTSAEDIVVRFRFSPFENIEDGIDGRVIVAEDITEKVVLEQYLIMSEKMIAKGEMAAAIGHELNNYLATISSNAQLLSINVANQQYEKVGPKIDAIISSIDKMKRFTSGLMDFSGLETRKTMHDIGRLIDDVLFFIKPQQKFRGIKIEVDVVPDIPKIEIDVGQIHQVLVNLLVNAADAIRETDAIDGVIKIACGHGDGFVVLTVSDNGPGIQPEMHHRIFEPYYTTKKAGHGLGLSTSHRIVNGHKGRLTGNNGTTGGAVFTIELPIKQ
jgi:two-component system NtrC family sensor kinase